MKNLLSAFVFLGFVILAAGSSDSGSSSRSGAGIPAVDPPRQPTVILNESRANREDIKQARQFVRDMPDACSRKEIEVEADGTVEISFFCSGNGKVMSGSVKIKDGIVREIN